MRPTASAVRYGPRVSRAVNRHRWQLDSHELCPCGYCAGEKNVREWSVDSGTNVTTIDAFSIGMAGAIKSISVVEGRLWCGRTDGSVTVFDTATGNAVRSVCGAFPAFLRPHHQRW